MASAGRAPTRRPIVQEDEEDAYAVADDVEMTVEDMPSGAEHSRVAMTGRPVNGAAAVPASEEYVDDEDADADDTSTRDVNGDPYTSSGAPSPSDGTPSNPFRKSAAKTSQNSALNDYLNEVAETEQHNQRRAPPPEADDVSGTPSEFKRKVLQARNLAGRAWTKVIDTSFDLFGARIVCERTEGSARRCFCVVENEVRLAIWLLLGIISAIVVALFVYANATGHVTWDRVSRNEHIVAVAISAAFCVAASFITYVQVKAHYANWTHPKTQIKIVRIVVMVPIYAWSALIGLFFIEWAPYVDFVRICYEAYVIYNFLLLLTKYLGGHAGVVAVLKEKPSQYVRWPEPCCCVPKAHLGSTFLWAIKRGTMQYVLITPPLAFGAVILDVFHLYGDGVIDWNKGYIYVAIIQNVTQLVALYCLIWLYIILKDDLAPFKPLAKFLVVKSVVFFTFWQGIGINIMVRVGWITGRENFTAAEVQLGLQDFIICIEMFIAAAVHRYTFGHEMFADGSYEKMMEDCRARALKKGVVTEDDMKDSFFDADTAAYGLESPAPSPRIKWKSSKNLNETAAAAASSGKGKMKGKSSSSQFLSPPPSNKFGGSRSGSARRSDNPPLGPPPDEVDLSSVPARPFDDDADDQDMPSNSKSAPNKGKAGYNKKAHMEFLDDSDLV